MTLASSKKKQLGQASRLRAQSAETARSRSALPSVVTERRRDLSRHTSARAISSPNGQHPIALIDMTLPQLAEAYNGLDRLEKQYENMSGICATLKGMVLVEAKTKPENKGKFMNWVKENFASAGHRTATRYMRLAEAFMKGLDSTVQFDTLTRDLAASVEALREFQLDLSHPVVSKVAEWVNGRGSYQLMLDFPGERGGDTSSHRGKKLLNKSPDEIARESAQIYCLPLQQKLFDVIQGKEHLLWLPVQAGPEEASLSIIRRELEELLDLVRQVIKRNQRARA